MSNILEIAGLEVRYAKASSSVLRGIDLALAPGKALGIVGESGSGKSTVLWSIMGLLSPGALVTAGSIIFGGQNILKLAPPARRALRGEQIAMVFQDPFTTLNPSLRIGLQLTEALVQRKGMNAAQAKAEGLRLMEEVRLPRPTSLFDAYPHQLSGGMKQRIVIAMALACSPKLLLLDEPTTALDVTVEATILDVLAELQASRGLSMVFVSHNLGVVERVCSDIAVMNKGSVVEVGTASDVLYRPKDAYTRKLLSSLPRLNAEASKAHAATTNAIDITDLALTFKASTGMLASVAKLMGRPPVAGVRALDKVSLTLGRGEILGVVGESGSGKSTLGRCIAGVYTPDHGSVLIGGEDIVPGLSNRTPADWRRAQMVFQNPDSSLNPRHTIGDSVRRPLTLLGKTGVEIEQRTAELMGLMRLPLTYLDRYPHQLSGGEKQRVGIARALAMEPEILICDEATSALDVTVQAFILELIQDLRQRLGVSIIFISHDLAVVSQISDRVIVMLSGQIVEQGPTSEVLGRPQHEYTQRLLNSVPPFVKQAQAPLETATV